LLDGGPRFLTAAFRAFGTLSDDSVARVIECREAPGGSTGRKVVVSVEYDAPEQASPTKLFVKFSRDFDNPARDRGRTQMEPEVRFRHTLLYAAVMGVAWLLDVPALIRKRSGSDAPGSRHDPRIKDDERCARRCRCCQTCSTSGSGMTSAPRSSQPLGAVSRRRNPLRLCGSTRHNEAIPVGGWS
jgi:hypothetical protein